MNGRTDLANLERAAEHASLALSSMEDQPTVLAMGRQRPRWEMKGPMSCTDETPSGRLPLCIIERRDNTPTPGSGSAPQPARERTVGALEKR